MRKTDLPQYILALACIVAIFAAKTDYQGRLQETENVLWTAKVDPASFDFEYGVGGKSRQPQPPFQFVDEDVTGTSSKVNVTDARGASWNVKWGHEVKPSIFCTRLVAACGYFVEPEYFVARGHIDGAHDLKRAGSKISRDGSFANARFQLRSDVPRFLDGKSWAWTSNPFLGTHQLQGLKLLMLLVSNWDAKDSRDMFKTNRRGVGMNTNMGIFQDDTNGVTRFLYVNDDWGASLGKWGGTFTWTKWDCRGFAAQTPHFVKGMENGLIRFGFSGKHEQDLSGNITVDDVNWLLQYLGRITDDQIRMGLTASGATAEETDCYTNSLRQRIEKLQQVAEQSQERAK